MKNGNYTLIIAPEKYPGKKYRGRYAYEHHVIYWKKYKITPQQGFVVHHKNGNHRDNRLSNLELLTVKQHNAHHSFFRRAKQIEEPCGFCGKKFLTTNRSRRERIKTSLYKKLFCSRSCGAKHHQQKLKPPCLF